MLLSPSVERFGVSHMRDFYFKCCKIAAVRGNIATFMLLNVLDLVVECTFFFISALPKNIYIYTFVYEFRFKKKCISKNGTLDASN